MSGYIHKNTFRKGLFEAWKDFTEFLKESKDNVKFVRGETPGAHLMFLLSFLGDIVASITTGASI